MEAMRLSLLEHDEQQRRQNVGGNNDSNSDSTQNAIGTTDANGNNSSPAGSPSPSPRPFPPPSADLSVLPRSTSPATNDQSPSPSLSRLCSTPSPPDNSNNVPSSLAPSNRTHRRVGSTPSSPSGPTLAAALSAAQTASAFLSPAEGRQAQNLPLPRSAPQTRAASPNRHEPAEERDGSARRGIEEIHTTPSVVVYPSDESSETEPTASTSSSEPSSALMEHTLTLSSVSDGGGDSSSRGPAGSHASTSSTGSSDPLLGWVK